MLINNKQFSNQPVKIKQEEYKKLVEMSINNDHSKENLLDSLYHEKSKNVKHLLV